MTSRSLTRPSIWLLVLLLALPIGKAAAVPSDVSAQFESSGCRIVRVKKVANTQLDGQIVYVAWCSAMSIYLSVMKCEYGICRIIP